MFNSTPHRPSAPVQPEPSLERIYPKEQVHDDNHGTLKLHMDRYRFAIDHTRGRHLLDVACGCGYGTALLAEAHPRMSCTGLDIDPKAITYANQHYLRDNARFICRDVMEQSLNQTFDTIVTLETIEHLPDPVLFAERLAQIMSPDGIIIASAPVTPTMDGNPHHLHDLTEASFTALFTRHGLKMGARFDQTQPFFGRSSGDGQNDRTRSVPRNLLRYYRRHPAGLIKRIGALCRFGFTNRYLTAIFTK